jgi:hypothetical protein
LVETLRYSGTTNAHFVQGDICRQVSHSQYIKRTCGNAVKSVKGCAPRVPSGVTIGVLPVEAWLIRITSLFLSYDAIVGFAPVKKPRKNCEIAVKSKNVPQVSWKDLRHSPNLPPSGIFDGTFAYKTKSSSAGRRRRGFAYYDERFTL